MARLMKTRFKCSCKGPLKKVPFHNEYHCDHCFKVLRLPYDKARQENMKTYLDKGRIMSKAVIRDGDVWYR
jgi:hypothetical protein